MLFSSVMVDLDWCNKMASRIAFIILVVSFCSAYDVPAGNSSIKTLKFPNNFYAAGDKLDLVRSFVENFEIWYSQDEKRIRTDYYDHNHRVYYEIIDEKKYCYYKVYPVTTKMYNNKETCELFCVNESISLHNIPEIPKIDNLLAFTYKSQMNMNGKIVEVWEKKYELNSTTEIQDIYKLIAETIYVYNDERSNFSLPIKYIKKTTAKADGTSQHVIVNYNRFTTIIASSDLEYTGYKSCVNKTTPTNFVPANHFEDAFHSYKKQYDRKYISDEHEMRKQIFLNNWRMVMEHNNNNTSYKMALNQFSDRTSEELQHLTGALPTDPSVQGTIAFPHTDEELGALSEHLPKEFDWRLKGVLGPVKDQGYCGSCYAFSVVGTLEAMIAIQNGDVMDLSEQSIVDCGYGYSNTGCKGGYIHTSFKYIMDNGVPLESDYEYKMREGPCQKSKFNKTRSIKGFVKVTPRHPSALKVALVKYGPVVVSVTVTTAMVQYSNGIFYDVKCEGKPANHYVVIVGYGNRDGVPYWIVKNSWGENFGLDGYILMAEQDNNCSILDAPFYPIYDDKHDD